MIPRVLICIRFSQVFERSSHQYHIPCIGRNPHFAVHFLVSGIMSLLISHTAETQLCVMCVMSALGSTQIGGKR